MPSSRLQEQTREMLARKLPTYQIIENSRPDWLNGLELDLYVPQLRIAIEVQGGQHYNFIPFFHKTFDDFVAQVNRDLEKSRMCQDQGITLIEIADSIDLIGLEEDFLPTFGLMQESEWFRKCEVFVTRRLVPLYKKRKVLRSKLDLLKRRDCTSSKRQRRQQSSAISKSLHSIRVRIKQETEMALLDFRKRHGRPAHVSNL